MGTVPRTEDLYSAHDPGSELARRRDAVLRRWLGMEVERASVGELAERPLSDRLRELEGLFDAAVSELRSSSGERRNELGAALERELERQRKTGAPFTVAVLAAPEREDPGSRRWLSALSEAAEDGTVVLEAGNGLAAAIMSAVRRDEAAAAVDRLRALAWSASGCEGRLPDAGQASCPEDGCSPDELLAAAHARLQRVTDASLDRSALERVEAAASVTPLYPELS
jgi:hypothetical protein